MAGTTKDNRSTFSGPQHDFATEQSVPVGGEVDVRWNAEESSTKVAFIDSAKASFQQR
jgi:hypothetical protein